MLVHFPSLFLIQKGISLEEMLCLHSLCLWLIDHYHPVSEVEDGEYSMKTHSGVFIGLYFIHLGRKQGKNVC